MGIGIDNATLIARSVRKFGCTGRLLQLGRQNVHLTSWQFLDLLLREGFASRELGDIVLRHDIGRFAAANEYFRTDLEAGGEAEKFLNDKMFFHAFGLEAYSCDIAPYENPDYLVDLTGDARGVISERFDVVYNGGTLEHIFDPAACLRNIHRLLKPGGWAIQVTPSEGFFNHGFYQISPILLLSFYEANGYEILLTKLTVRRETHSLVCDYNPDYRANAGEMTLLFSVARKTTDTDDVVMPVQSFPRPDLDEIFRFTFKRHASQLGAMAAAKPNARVAAWCAGGYARYFLENAGALCDRVAVVVDGAGGGEGRLLAGKAVVAPQEFFAMVSDIDAVLVLTPNSIGLRGELEAMEPLRGMRVFY
jgi:SAM-dependent methyltransferase